MLTNDDLPDFADLPVRTGAPPHSSWGLWGDDDRLGCWNLVDDAASKRGANCVRTGRTFRLDAPHDPQLTIYMGRLPFEHRVEPIMGVAWDDVIDSYNTQNSTQWDGFGHYGSEVHGHYGGLERGDHGVDHWAARSFATRGVLADVARWRDKQGRPLDLRGGEVVPVAELYETLEDQGSTVEPGDILLIRFGWLDWWRAGGSVQAKSLVVPGLEPSLQTAEALWNLHIAAVGCDPALDPIPGKWLSRTAPPTPEEMADPGFHLNLSLHAVLPFLGLPIGEFFDLDALAEDCEASEDWYCMLTTAPMHLPEGMATPANAIAIR